MPGFQVIVLGSSGGPREDTITGLLVRSAGTNWCKSSIVAVDAGTLLAGIARALDAHIPQQKRVVEEGPFKGLELPCVTPQANAAYIFRELIATVLITHPHLDHVSGLAINTPVVEAEYGPKAVAALPSAIAALKNHIFNDITWPNLSDEDGGAGLVTYQRLVDGGNPRFGRGEGKGYLKVCEGLTTKCLSVSHGQCSQRYNPETGKHHRAESTIFSPEPLLFPGRRLSADTRELAPYATQQKRSSGSSGKDLSVAATTESSAFFIRDEKANSEIIVFGDIEPDSISLEPRNEKVWSVAAPKIAAGILRAIFIECSYSNSVEDGALYGHLCPRHLIAELGVLASKVLDAQKPRSSYSGQRKRKRPSPSSAPGSPESVSPKSVRPAPTDQGTTEPQQTSGTQEEPERRRTRSLAYVGGTTSEGSSQKQQREAADDPVKPPATGAGDDSEARKGQSDVLSHPDNSGPLRGLGVYIIHIKETLADGPHPREKILEELREQSREAGLGCEFYAPMSGEAAFV